MKTIIILAKIIAILFVLKLESRRISRFERSNEFKSIHNLRNKVIEEYLSNYDQHEAFKILSQYILNEVEIYGFAEHLNRTGNPPEWSKTRKLENYEYYSFLKYSKYVEKLKLTYLEADIKMKALKKKISLNLSDSDKKEFYVFYNETKLSDLISYEDYCALQIFKKYNVKLNMESPASWRIKKALYSLAIRQYSSQATMNYIPTTCFFKKQEEKTFFDNMKKGDSFEKKTFSICSTNYEKSYSSTPQYLLDSSSYLTNYKVLIMDPITIVSLEDILDVNDEEIYVILPKVDLTILSDPQFSKDHYGLNVFIEMSTSPIYERSNWLTQLANEIEKFKKKENEYFDSLL